MADDTRTLDEVRAALHSEPRFGPHGHVDLALSEGTLILEGQVADVAVKKLVLERAAAHPAVEGILDRLRVAPAEPMADGEIRDHVRAALLQDPAFAELRIREVVKGEVTTVHDPPAPPLGEICVSVNDGVVTLDGDVPGLGLKRMAGVLAWWVPGSRDVVNGLGTEPPEEDSDDEISDAVRMALEKDPFVNASQVRVATRDCRVTLDGLVPTDAEREMAEFDAWFVFGVDNVDNRIAVRPVPATGGRNPPPSPKQS